MHKSRPASSGAKGDGFQIYSQSPGHIYCTMYEDVFGREGKGTGRPFWAGPLEVAPGPAWYLYLSACREVMGSTRCRRKQG